MEFLCNGVLDHQQKIYKVAPAISNEREKTKEYYGMIQLKIDESDLRHLTYDYSTG